MLKTERVQEAFKRRLQAAMKARGVSPWRLAAEADVSHATIYGYLEAKRLPRLDILVAIAETLDVSLDWLAGGKSRKGTWIPEGALSEMCTCSACGTVFRNFGEDKFCRECGAKMDGGKNE